METGERRAASIPWWNQGWLWFLGGLGIFLLLSSLLGWGNAAGALTAAFTGLVALYTWRLAELQGEVNQVMQQQTHLIRQQTELMERQKQIQESQHQLQEELAKSEVRPLVALQARPRGGHKLELTNLGRYGVMIVKLKQYQQRPNAPDSESHLGTPAASEKQSFPLPLPSGRSKELRNSSFEPSKGEWVEVVYEDGASGQKLSDLWRYTGSHLGFVREWWARKVPDDK